MIPQLKCTVSHLGFFNHRLNWHKGVKQTWYLKKKIIYRTPIQSKTVYPCKLWFYLILLTNQNLITPSCIAYSLSVLKDGEQLHRSEIHTKYVFDGPNILLSFLCMIKTN